MCVPLPVFPFLYASSAVRAQQAVGWAACALLLVQGPRSLSDGVFTLEWKIGRAVSEVCYSPNSLEKGCKSGFCGYPVTVRSTHWRADQLVLRE
ncbi:hypothetical protein WH47_04083 [Habropoda laboriosa]|uniref:Uncharacterized protein n=1 Tax=Habropoda laboriosa TaxID=597456 RepID=A0A0L7QJP0_9HYME|nr:hypothetical protein WH47_04083 [Habropoda laboriosa]